MYLAKNRTILPIIQHCILMLPNNQALNFLELLLNYKNTVDNHRNLRNISIDEFGKYSEGLSNIYNDLTNSIKELKETQKN
mgnify:CR=1 FL=1